MILAGDAHPVEGAALAAAPLAEPKSSPNGADAADGPTVRRLDHPEAEPVDLVDAAGASVAKRVVPLAIGGLVLLLFVRGLRRRRSS
jgi:hypothetical protein